MLTKKIISLLLFGFITGILLSASASAQENSVGSAQSDFALVREEFEVLPKVVQRMCRESENKETAIKDFFYRAGVSSWESGRLLVYDEIHNLIIVTQDEKGLGRIRKILETLHNAERNSSSLTASFTEEQPVSVLRQPVSGRTRDTERCDRAFPKKDFSWAAMFPDGLIKAGEKAKSASTKHFEGLEGKFVGAYFSASWCGPCRMFTPRLVKFYKRNKKDIEIVFVSADKTEDKMIAYAKKDKMKWLAVPFGKRCLAKRRGGGIPNFVVFAPDGSQFTEIIGAGKKSFAALEEMEDAMKKWREKNEK